VDAGVYYGWGKNEIIKIIQLMFSFDGVKIEEDPFNSLLNPDCFNHCITSFYDHDSEQAEIAQAKCSSQEVQAMTFRSFTTCTTLLISSIPLSTIS
jgi:hypothetical protein